MSDIKGTGYGDKHDWENKGTEGTDYPITTYICKKCKCQFRHFYKIRKDIFEAMKELKVRIPEECK